MFLADSWTDYEVLDTGDGEKLERWGDIILRRPDPQTIWPRPRRNCGRAPRPTTTAASAAAGNGNSWRNFRTAGR